MFTATAAAATLSAATTPTTSFAPGFYLMIALFAAGIAGTLAVGWHNHHRRHR
ncbi:hypothetical protein QQX09_01015 [Demequina sp. SYSU T00192]|uniref:Uncharacterized protein n=1 Tax=Demequina litoralis TaxID=3051660 RepID=A0ABT8G689_9MICO|nr:hypothetical protein [Demequina sp. SYSU T00192]MDN4474429.1 hypothetical protein [Demequina sp. SYSU T00192]